MKLSTKLILIFLGFLVFIGLVTWLHSFANQESFIISLDKFLISILTGLLDYLSQPLITGIILIFLVLYLGIPGNLSLFKLFSEIKASFGELSLSGKLRTDELIIRDEQSDEILPKIDYHEEGYKSIINMLSSNEVNFLISVANKKLSSDELVDFGKKYFIKSGAEFNATRETFVLGLAFGTLSLLDPILIDFDIPADSDTYNVVVDKEILDLFYERAKLKAVAKAPDKGIPDNSNKTEKP